MLSDRFGAYEAIANSSIKLARVAPEEELAIVVLVAAGVLEFAEDLRARTGPRPPGADGHTDARPA